MPNISGHHTTLHAYATFEAQKANIEWLLWYGELESTCAPCHDALIQKEEVRGYAIGCDESGRRIASDHPWNRQP